MNFGIIILNQNIKTMQNYDTSIQTALSLILKRKIFMRILLMMLMKDLTHQIVSAIDHCLLEKTKKLLVL